MLTVEEPQGHKTYPKLSLLSSHAAEIPGSSYNTAASEKTKQKSHL